MQSLHIPNTINTSSLSRLEIAVSPKPYRYQDYLEPEALANQPKVFPRERYYDELLSIYPKAFEYMRLVGVHPDQIEPSRTPYLQLLPDPIARAFEQRFSGNQVPRLSPDSGYNIGDHQMTACWAGRKFAKLSFPNDEQSVWLIGYLLDTHDLNKLSETGRAALSRALKVLSSSEDPADQELLKTYLKAVRSLDPDTAELFANIGSSPYSDDAYLRAAKMLTLRGVPQEVTEAIVTSGRFTGHTSFKYLLAGNQEGGFRLRTDLLFECLVHFFDDITHSPYYRDGQREPHYYLNPGDRMRQSDFINKYPFMLREGVGIFPNGEVGDVSDLANPPEGVKACVSYMDMQPALSEAIAAFMLHMLGEVEVSDASSRIVSIINNRLSNEDTVT